MQRFRAWMTAGLLGAAIGGWSAQAAADDDRGAEYPIGLQAAAYDLLLVPRSGAGVPHVLTERGWRRLAPRMSRPRSWTRTPTFDRPQPRRGWDSRYAYREVRPDGLASRRTGYDGGGQRWRQSWSRQRLD